MFKFNWKLGIERICRSLNRFLSSVSIDWSSNRIVTDQGLIMYYSGSMYVLTYFVLVYNEHLIQMFVQLKSCTSRLWSWYEHLYSAPPFQRLLIFKFWINTTFFFAFEYIAFSIYDSCGIRSNRALDRIIVRIDTKNRDIDHSISMHRYELQADVDKLRLGIVYDRQIEGYSYLLRIQLTNFIGSLSILSINIPDCSDPSLVKSSNYCFEVRVRWVESSVLVKVCVLIINYVKL